MATVLIVGAGLAGAVYARELADRGHSVRAIDKRPHIAGNCFDHVTDAGVRVHDYGPHLFHTSNERVVEWVKRFADWDAYEHKVVARLPDGRLVPLPINLDTVNAVFGTQLANPEQMINQLAKVSVARHPVLSAEDHLYAHIGEELTNLFFRPYTKKMWGLDLTDMDASVVRRLQVRNDRNSLYFANDNFQAMPRNGYFDLFCNILNHPNIDVKLSTSFKHSMIDEYDFCFNSMPIDEFYGFDLGELPYRSIRFHVETAPIAAAPPHVTINYTHDGPLTRETWWHNIPGHLVSNKGIALRTVETPCDYRDNGYERYYPIKTHDRRFESLYQRYAARTRPRDRVQFIGRCGTYQYLDMHQVINQSLTGAAKWLLRA